MYVNKDFDKSVAATYDDDLDAFNPEVVEPIVNFLAELANG